MQSIQYVNYNIYSYHRVFLCVCYDPSKMKISVLKKIKKMIFYCNTKLEASRYSIYNIALDIERPSFIIAYEFISVRSKKLSMVYINFLLQIDSLFYSMSSSSSNSSSSAVASWYCWYSETKSFIFDSASVNSISSIPSPVYQ